LCPPHGKPSRCHPLRLEWQRAANGWWFAHHVDVMKHIIQEGRVFLRPIERSDAELYQRWRSDAQVTALAGFPHPLSLAQVEQRIQVMTEKQGDDGYSFLICLLADDRLIGEAMLFHLAPQNGSAELGIFIGEADEWQKGYGTDAP